MLRTLAILGLVSMLIITPGLIQDNQWGLMVIYVVALGFIWGAALNRNANYRLRAGLFLLIEYGVGLIDLINFGLAEEGRTFLFGFSVTAIILMGARAGIGALGLSIATIAIVGWQLSAGQLVILQPANISSTRLLTMEVVITTCAIFLMQAGLVMAALYALLRDFDRAWQRERLAVSQVEQERNLLEQRVAERTYELAQARDQALEVSRLKSEFLAKVSHELRTPLGVILGYTELLQGGLFGQVTDKQVDVIQQVISSTQYLTDLVGQLLDQAKFEDGRIKLITQTFNLRDICQQVEAEMQVLAQAKNLTLVAEIASNLPLMLSGDSERLRQILINLVGNAIKFTKAGKVEVRFHRSGRDYWTIQVADSGPGIPKEAQAYIFEPFRQIDDSITREYSGAGLGLSIVKQLVTLMGGEISLDSEIGQGSTFTVLLPLTPIPEKTI
jgi:signal transduction histidine kinase